MDQLDHQRMAEGRGGPRGGFGVRRDGDRGHAVGARHAQAVVVQQQVPEAREAVHGDHERGRVEQAEPEVLERARADRARPQAQHLVAHEERHALVHANELLARDACAVLAQQLRREAGLRGQQVDVARAQLAARAAQQVLQEADGDGGALWRHGGLKRRLAESANEWARSASNGAAPRAIVALKRPIPVAEPATTQGALS
ncbi:hypothetical protein D3C72_1774810 [compost metagenome]